MAFLSRKLFLYLIPVSLFAVVAVIWRYRKRNSLKMPLPSSTKNDDVTEELSIASDFVGFVIGRQGNKVKELEKQSNTRIRFREANDGKVVMVTGTRDNVEKAKVAILTSIKEKTDKKSVDLVVPHFAIGRLIGRQGQNITAMQKESGARITLDRGSGPTRMCTVLGSNDQVTRGVALVHESISESEAAQQRNRLSRKLKTDNLHMKATHMHGHHKSSQKQLPNQCSVTLKPCLLPSGQDFFAAVVSNVSMDANIWVQPISGRGAMLLNDLTDIMMVTYSSMSAMEHKLTNPSINMFCAATFTGDDQWYRAQVMDIDSSMAYLQYVDYGDEEWHAIDDLKVLLPQFCSLPIQASKCQLGVAAPVGGWNEEAIEFIEETTLCAKWEPVMVKVTNHAISPPQVAIVNTSGDKDLDVASKLQEYLQQISQEQYRVSPSELSVNMSDKKPLDHNVDLTQSVHLEMVDETVVMGNTPVHLESSMDIFDDMEEALKQFDDQDSDQKRNTRLEPILETAVLNTTTEVSKELDDQQAYVAKYSSDQLHEMKEVSVTFDSDSEDDVISQVVEDGIITNEEHSGQASNTEPVSVTIDTTNSNN